MSDRIVNHPKYGSGVVKLTRHKGFELLVHFQDGLGRWVRLDEVKENKIQPPPISSELTVSPDENFKSRRMIEAFRLGIVPYNCVDEFTIGRQSETRQILDWLDNPEESTLLLVGEYGTGKTHLLHYAFSRALQEGFAVAFVEMDPNEVPFFKPKRVYSRLIQTFSYRPKQSKQVEGFRDFLKKVLAEGVFKDHIYFNRLTGKTSDETLWDWIEGRESILRPYSPYDYGYSYSNLPGLYDYSTTSNIYCYLLSALGWAAKEILGLKGLVLFFDEAEAVNDYDYTYQIKRSYNFLKALIRMARGDKLLLGNPQDSRLSYCGVGFGSRIPFLYRLPSGVKILFAFTFLGWNYEHAWIDSSYQLIPKVNDLESASRINLEPLTDEALKEVFEHLCLLYDSAYDFLEEDLKISKIFRQVTTQGGRTRLFVKGSVEALDLTRFYHREPLDEVLQ